MSQSKLDKAVDFIKRLAAGETTNTHYKQEARDLAEELTGDKYEINTGPPNFLETPGVANRAAPGDTPSRSDEQWLAQAEEANRSKEGPASKKASTKKKAAKKAPAKKASKPASKPAAKSDSKSTSTKS